MHMHLPSEWDTCLDALHDHITTTAVYSKEFPASCLVYSESSGDTLNVHIQSVAFRKLTVSL